jgi:predicted outer membrane repeat protein
LTFKYKKKYNSNVMKSKILVPFLLIAVLLPYYIISAEPTTSYEAELVVKGWLQNNSGLLGTSGRQTSNVETFKDDSGITSYYIVNLKPSGYVIVSADDLVEPIIGFADDGTFDPSFDNPLGALVINDMNNRLSAVRQTIGLMSLPQNSTQTKEQNKWQIYLTTAKESQSGFQLMALNYVTDVRVPPLVQSRWDQSYVSEETCYNYYTPGKYPCGCLATALAQLMRYFEYPVAGIGKISFNVKVDTKYRTYTTVGGDDQGGPYQWTAMVLKPASYSGTLSEAQRKAIGSICYDAGLGMKMEYSQGGSGAEMSDANNALKNTFHYSNVYFGNDEINGIGSANLLLMINPSLDTGSPVVLGIFSSLTSSSGHAVLCDGYAYDITTSYNRSGNPSTKSTPYHHINMGWGGTDDAWYNLPDIQTFKTITCCLYNIFTTEKGEIISGRVLDPNNNPITGACVYADTNESDLISTVTNYRGIYAFKGLSSNTQYTVWANIDGYETPHQTVHTNISQNDSTACGNVWGVDFYTDKEPNYPPSSTFFVDDNAPNDPAPSNPEVSDPNEDGSAEHPFDSIQQAIDATKHRDIVIIRRGIYNGNGNRDIDFRGKAITVASEDPNDPNLVIIDCNASVNEPHRAFVFQTYEIPKSVLSGVTITGGYSEYAGSIYFTNSARPTVTKCVFISNRASAGGAVYNKGGSPVISNCIFKSNQANAGGAIYNYTDYSGCSPVITDCIFYGNTSAYNGGAIYNYGPVTPTLTKCTFTSNYSSKGGGAIRNYSTNNLSITNCIFSTNKAETYGGGIRNSVGCNVKLINCTFYSNLAASGKSVACTPDDQAGVLAGSVSILNSIINDGGGEIYNSDSSTITVTYTNLKSSVSQDPWSGEGNMYLDPLFADVNKGDFHLKSQAGRFDPNSTNWITDEVTSPCIDAGNPLTKIGQEPEPNGDRINMGAYGGTEQASKSYSN